MQTFSLTLSRRELTFILLALRKFREAILDSDDDELGDDLDDLMILDSALKKLEDVRESQMAED